MTKATFPTARPATRDFVFASRRPAIAVLAVVVALVIGWIPSDCSAQTTGMVEFFSAGKQHQGMALVELAHEMIVLGRDGSIHSVDPRKGNNVRRIRDAYEPMPVTELRNQLRAEYGPEYEVTSTKNFLVVQPKGRGDRWPQLFEQSHRSFTAYMTKRGVNVREGRFPMVAVVFPDQQAMYREFRKLKIDVSRVAGVYSNESNRVLTHDGGHLSLIAATVRHEAAHQSAFNSGVHSRVTDTPKWITEGIGQMFESPAMTSRQSGSRASNRANTDSINLIRSTLSDRNEVHFYKAVVQLIGDDMLFDSDKTVDKAYAVSWAMMFYLAERQPREFAKWMNHTAKRPAFRNYEKADRIRDFEQIVGLNPLDFSKRVQWFIESL
ncbi:DUF1570 domain-containing protein [Planctomycetes bacterium K23_9]|uniref:DUF1570 domain-containing protein n=1 Tax=Stieleria marina TaxID=1930275 RepID=A0A517NQC6_9BACT|nr:hypothetical protein K239x_12660 [Planctomycetes bacterium K23_9]